MALSLVWSSPALGDPLCRLGMAARIVAEQIAKCGCRLIVANGVNDGVFSRQAPHLPRLRPLAVEARPSCLIEADDFSGEDVLLDVLVR